MAYMICTDSFRSAATISATILYRTTSGSVAPDSSNNHVRLPDVLLPADEYCLAGRRSKM